ncbi:MAG: glycosyltransferase family 2 protein [Flavobacteriales bacterium]
MNDQPLISIITVTWNAEHLVGRTMQSIAEQTYISIEHILVDGQSNDNTVAEVIKFGLNSKIICEKDNGIYDAMNKGLKAAKGEYVIFMNAGDSFFDKQTLARCINKGANADVYYGNTAVVNQNGETLADRRLAPPENLDWRSLRYGMCVSHQSIVAKRVLCPQYDTRYKISADIDWTIRLLKAARLVVNVQGYVSKFLEGGTSAKRRRLGLRERWRIMAVHYGVPATILNHAYIAFRFVWHRITRKSMT